MAILDADAPERSNIRPSHQQPNQNKNHKPPLFVRTLLPSCAITHTVSCSLVPSAALDPSSATSTTSSASTANPSSTVPSCYQLVAATANTLYVYAVHDGTQSLRPLTQTTLFTTVYDLASVTTPVPGRDVLVVLSASGKVSFFQFDDASRQLRVAGQLSLPLTAHPTSDAASSSPAPPQLPSRREASSSLRTHPYLLATHPRKHMVAVASTYSTITVFPVLFLHKQVNAGKMASISVDGTVLSLDFLEDDDGVPGDAVILALIQHAKYQVLALYTVGVSPDSAGGLSVTFAGSMITCASHPDDTAVARAASKLTGQPIHPTPSAVAVSRLPGCPYLFAVFVHGRVIAGDARSVVVQSNVDGESSLPMSVRIEDDIVLPNHPNRIGDPHASAMLDDMEANPSALDTLCEAASYHSPDVPSLYRSSNQQTTLSSAAAAAAASAATAASADGLVATPTGSDGGGGPSTTSDGYATPVRTPVIHLEPPSAPLQSRRIRRIGREDIPPLPSLARRARLSGSSGLMGNIGEDCLSYLFIPAYVTLDVGDSNGVPMSWVDARNHFYDEEGATHGLYVVFESGALYALKWAERVRDGTTTFRIPGVERSGTSPIRHFSIEYVGDVGPAVSVAALDRRLLFVANEGADSSLRRLRLPHLMRDDICQDSFRPSCARRLSGRTDGLCYGLEVRQEFLNLSPISDFVIAPTVAALSHKKNGSARTEKCIERVRDAKWDLLRCSEEDDCELQSALDHVMNGGREESELIVCSGIGRYGSVRLIRRGAPVSIFASTDRAFPAVNNMWSLRFSRNSVNDAAIIITFAQATRLLLSVPARSFESVIDNGEERHPSKIASLIDGTEACGILKNTRTLRVGLISDGVFAQIHEGGIRVIVLKKADVFSYSRHIVNDALSAPLVEKVLDWAPPADSFISVGATCAGYILVSVVQRGVPNDMLYLLQALPADSGCNTDVALVVVSSVKLEYETSSLEISDSAESRTPFSCSPHLAIVGTYAPSFEVRALGLGLKVLARFGTTPWWMEDVMKRRHEKSDIGESSDARRPFAKSLGDALRNEIALTVQQSLNVMTAVPESMCAVDLDGKRHLFVGLRDGSVLTVLLDGLKNGNEISDKSFRVVSHRKIGDCPVSLTSVECGIGPVLVAEAERPWICVSLGGGRIRWTPLGFPETRAVCSYSVLGAERSFIVVGSDDCLYVCGLRRHSETSVRSIHVGATPRRVICVPEPEGSIVVATSSDMQTKWKKAEDELALSHMDDNHVEHLSRSTLRVYDRRSRLLSGKMPLMAREKAHVVANWAEFVVVGTSLGFRTLPGCKRGRLLLFLLTRSPHSRDASLLGAIPGRSGKDKTNFELCSEVILPGAVLAGTVNEEDNLLVASCNREVVIFTVIRQRQVLVEVARVSARTMVVGLSMQQDMVCVVDRKDSIGFFQFRAKSGKLVRDRGDHRRRVVSDAVMVDRTMAFGVDRFGGFFSVGYAEGDGPPMADRGLHGASLRSAMFHEGSGGGRQDDDDIDDREDADMLGLAITGEIMQLVGGVGTGVTVVSEAMTGGGNTANGAAGGGIAGAMPEAVAAAQVGVGAELNELQLRGGIPRNLVSHHRFNVGDVCTTVRVAHPWRLPNSAPQRCQRASPSDSRRATPRDYCHAACSDKSSSVSGSTDVSIVCGTVGGSLVVATGMSSWVYQLLREVESALADNEEIMGQMVDGSHAAFRSVYGGEALDVIDGDLVMLFSSLGSEAKRRVLTRVGLEGEEGERLVEGVIDYMADRFS